MKSSFVQRFAKFVLSVTGVDGPMPVTLSAERGDIEIKQGDDMVFIPFSQAKDFHAAFGDYIANELPGKKRRKRKPGVIVASAKNAPPKRWFR